MDTRKKIATTYYVDEVGKLATLATSFYVKDLTGNTTDNKVATPG